MKKTKIKYLKIKLRNRLFAFKYKWDEYDFFDDKYNYRVRDNNGDTILLVPMTNVSYIKQVERRK